MNNYNRVTNNFIARQTGGGGAKPKASSRQAYNTAVTYLS